MSFISKSLLASIPEDDDLPLDEWAEKYVRFPGSPIAEDFRRDNIPMLIEPMRAWDDPKIWGVSVLAGVQGGKTGFEQIAVARALKKRPGNMMITTQTDSESAFFARRSFFRACVSLQARGTSWQGLGGTTLPRNTSSLPRCLFRSKDHRSPACNQKRFTTF